MQSRWIAPGNPAESSAVLFWLLALLSLGGVFGALATNELAFLSLPFLLLAVYLPLVDIRLVFFLLLACIPLSTEVTLPNGFGTDLPTEPLIVGLMLVYGLYALRHWPERGASLLRHPITILLLFHLSWMGLTVITSPGFFVSLKFFLAKTWYIVTFYFLATLMLRRESDVRRMFWFIFIPLIFTVLVTLLRHAAVGFTFADVHRILHPFYRNHVAYAAILVIFFPWIFFIRLWYPKGSFNRNLLNLALLVFLLAIYLAFTRAAYVALLAAAGAYFIIQLRLTRYVVLAAAVGAIILLGMLGYRNRYLELAPNYERTITHQDFNNLLEATYQGEDISTMERVHRWVAGLYMSQQRPVFGFGPGNFFFFYKPFTVNSFRTYVSNNPEQSGIHSYYLMLLAEQGYPGLLFFVVLIGFALIRGERLYHRLAPGRPRQLAMAILLSFIIILLLLIINDLIETDKVGPFFFIYLALLANLDRGVLSFSHGESPDR